MTISKFPSLHIAGIGSIGGLLACYFANTNHPVQLILKNKYQHQCYEQSRLTMHSETHHLTCHPPAFTIDSLPSEPIQYLLCCMKAHAICDFLISIKHLLNTQSIVILVHNGLGVLNKIQQQLPQLRIISGISTFGAYREKPFTVRGFLNGKLYLGKGIGNFSNQEIEMICNDFHSTGLPFHWEENIHDLIWDKFAKNCCINILTVIYQCKNGDLLIHGEALKKMTYEVATIVSAYGSPLTPAKLLFEVTELLKKVANNFSSMYKDIENKKTTELAYLNEYLCTLAQDKNIPAPFNNEIIKRYYERLRFSP